MAKPDESKMGRDGAESTRGKAEEYARDPKRVKKLLEDALVKARNRKGALAEMWESLMALIRLVRAWAGKKYTAIPWKSAVLAIAAIIYFVSPFDLIPDWMPAVGFFDDAAVITFVMRALKSDLDAFMKWEKEQPSA